MKRTIHNKAFSKYGFKMKKAAAASAVLLSLLLASCQMADGQGKDPEPVPTEQSRESDSPQTSNPQEAPDKAMPSGSETRVSAEALCGSYFKAGDFSFRMSIAPGEPKERDILNVVFSKRVAEPEYRDWSNALTVVHEFHLPFMEDAALYDLSDLNNAGSACTIELYEDGSISLRGDTEAAGRYYAYEGNLILPEALTRPLNAADLIGMDKEEMGLLRNEFYALYGRIFQTEKVKSYFEAQPWYEGTIPADQFSDEILGGMLKRNAAFLKSAEDAYDEAQAVSLQKAYEELEAAPYLDLLPKHGEFSVTMESDPSHAVDEGICYRARGTISVPVPITPEQYEALENGQEVTIAMDASSKETAVLQKQPDIFYKLTPVGAEDENLWEQVIISYDPFLNLYSMSRNSADTIFMEVYEGDIFVLKGATEEYYRYFDMAGGREESAGSFRVIDFEEIAGADETMPYSGNMPVFDSKGYLKALNYWGD